MRIKMNYDPPIDCDIPFPKKGEKWIRNGTTYIFNDIVKGMYDFIEEGNPRSGFRTSRFCWEDDFKAGKWQKWRSEKVVQR